MAAHLTSFQRLCEGGLCSSHVVNEEAEVKLHYWSVREGDDIRIQEHQLKSVPPNNKVIYFKVMDGSWHQVMKNHEFASLGALCHGSSQTEQATQQRRSKKTESALCR